MLFSYEQILLSLDNLEETPGHVRAVGRTQWTQRGGKEVGPEDLERCRFRGLPGSRQGHRRPSGLGSSRKTKGQACFSKPYPQSLYKKSCACETRSRPEVAVSSEMSQGKSLTATPMTSIIMASISAKMSENSGGLEAKGGLEREVQVCHLSGRRGAHPTGQSKPPARLST